MPKLKRIPWMLALELAMIARDHWGQLDPRDRSELARIVSRLDLVGAGRRMLPLAGKHRRRGKFF